jgi:cell division protein FtsA
VIPQEYVVDGHDGIKDPVGMSGIRLEADVHIVAGAQGPLQNLKRCARDAGIEVNGIVVQALASGLAVLTEAERELTTVLIDMGGGTTDVGVFKRGTLNYSSVIPLGGDHITQDISQLLRISPEEAERVKRRHGVAKPDFADRDLALEVAGSNYTQSLSAFELAQVIQPRVMEILDLVKRNVEQQLGALELVAGNIVITGGASLMLGVDKIASERFRLPVRIGKPDDISGLTDVVASPAHATAVGLVRFGMSEYTKNNIIIPQGKKIQSNDDGVANILGNIQKFFKDFF